MKLRQYKQARRFLAALRRSNKNWLPDDHWKVQWVFRGQRDARKEPVLSAWRTKVVQKSPLYRGCTETVSRTTAEDHREQWRSNLVEHLAIPGNECKELRSWLARIPRIPIDRVQHLVGQKKFEFLSVRAFVEVSDELGLPLAATPFLPHAPVPMTYDPLVSEDETDPFEPVVALAQHHGCPTRLLDWTQRPETAAFFAAERAEGYAGQLAVWALNLRKLAFHNSPVKPFSVARSSIGYLHAQEGLFTYATGADLRFAISGQWPSVEKICSQALIKMTLPWSEAAELRRLLYVEGVHRAALMPTYDNVAEMLKAHQKRWHGDH